MTDPDRFCRGCSSEAVATEVKIQQLLAEVELQGSVVTEELYRKRLDTCFECSSLLHGHTCIHCGCLVAVRAKLSEKDCPHPTASKWKFD
ncbi:DUF6171 family protein [Desmospora activa]|uniref:DUF6171 family protein n=1 Tax=Desmospora activa TaxID=500615 RepID=UPI000D2FE9A2|nr:DUF6171 family protein [Desmospora activa]